MSILEPILQLLGQLAQHGSHTYDQTLKTATTSKLPTANSPWTYAMTAFMLWHHLAECYFTKTENVPGNLLKIKQGRQLHASA